MDAVIALRNLTKSYGTRRGIEDVSLEVRRGEVFGFLGPNGAGKSTTIRILLGLLRPSGGQAAVFGLDPFRDAARVHGRVGYLPGEMGLAERLTAREHLSYLANLRGVPTDGRMEALAKRLDLDLSKRVRHMSRGNKQKVGLVQAFMGDPEILILDEPTTGLDPLMQDEFDGLVREARAAGRTVFLSSHIMSEVETLCDRVAIVRDGRLVVVEDIGVLKGRSLRRARIRFSQPVSADALRDVPGVVEAIADGNEVVCGIQGSVRHLVARLAELPLEDLRLEEATLEDAFRSYYEKGATP